MASTYSTSLKLELIGQGEQSGTWGVTTNNNFGSLVEQAITGVQSISMSNASYTLTNYDGAVDESRNAVLVFGGINIAPQNVIAPAVEKLYTLRNISGANVTIKTSSGNGVSVSNNSYAQVYCDGTNFFNATPSINDITGNLTVSGNAAVTGNVIVTGNETVSGNLTVTGSVTAGSFTGLGNTVRQIVTSVASSAPTTSSSTPQPSGHSASITPSSTSSKIMVLWTGAVAQPQYLGPETYALTQMYRNGVANSPTTGISVGSVGADALIAVTASGQSLCYIDSPSTTSALTYQMYYYALGGGQCTYNDLSSARINLLEIL
jgi:hypothetical protein